MASKGKIRLEIKYCVSCRDFWQPASIAAELCKLCSGKLEGMSVELTPVKNARFRISINGQKIDDQTIRRVVRQVRQEIEAALQAAAQPALA